MSVYRPKDRSGKEAPVYRYDFQLGGQRFAGSTGATTEREALRVEKAIRDKARAQVKQIREAKGSLWTWEQASSAYYTEKLGNRFDATSKSWALWLEDSIGLDTPILDIDTAFIQRLINHKRSAASGRGGRPLSGSTLNRTIQEPVRRVLRHASRVHKQPLGDVDWTVLKQSEPRERIRELRADEEERLIACVREDYRPFVLFCMLSGFRQHEAVKLRWRDIDFANGEIHVIGKGAKPAVVPMTEEMVALLEPLRGHHPEFVFTYLSRRSTDNHRGRGQAFGRGERYPMNVEAVKKMFMRFRDEAGLHDFRFHDLRHTALSRIVRATKNLRLAQALGRHESVKTTMRYVHVLNEDVREGMRAAAKLSTTLAGKPVAETPTKSPTDGRRPRKS